jgi:hypothetical protein
MKKRTRVPIIKDTFNDNFITSASYYQTEINIHPIIKWIGKNIKGFIAGRARVPENVWGDCPKRGL